MEQTLRDVFNATIDHQVERSLRARVHSIIPLAFFSAASTECKELYVTGRFYGCITLCQSVAEGLSKFLAEKNTMRVKKGFSDRVRRLKRAGFLSGTAANAFGTIHGRDRNDFHHLNKDIEQDYRKLEARAIECLNALHAVEAEVFAYDVYNGNIAPKNKKYWPSPDEGTVDVFVRSG